jgi:hypothetical protein
MDMTELDHRDEKAVLLAFNILYAELFQTQQEFDSAWATRQDIKAMREYCRCGRAVPLRLAALETLRKAVIDRSLTGKPLQVGARATVGLDGKALLPLGH